MIIYKCIISGDEMFSDIYKITETHDGLFLEVQGKTISRACGDIDDSLLGGNASAEEVQESNESSTETGVDIVLNHKLVETGFEKKTYTTYIKNYMKAVKERLEKDSPDRVEAFMKSAPAGVKVILGKFKDYQFFTGENMNPDGSVGLLDYREDGITPFMIFFKDGLEIEKC